MVEAKLFPAPPPFFFAPLVLTTPYLSCAEKSAVSKNTVSLSPHFCDPTRPLTRENNVPDEIRIRQVAIPTHNILLYGWWWALIRIIGHPIV